MHLYPKLLMAFAILLSLSSHNSVAAETSTTSEIIANVALASEAPSAQQEIIEIEEDDEEDEEPGCD